jgi:dolichyl-phosphate beta-glucosyltransferase
VGDAPQILIVVPCYNEGARLATDDFREFVASARDTRFLFVNDGSTDNTSVVLRTLAASDPTRFECLELRVNVGKAETVRQGMLHALTSDVRYVGYWDADLATPLAEIPRFAEVLDQDERCQVCLGSRVLLLGRVVDRRAHRHYLGRLFATVASYVLDLAVYDTQCGAKLFRVSPELHALFAQPFCVNWTFDVEIIARVQEQRARLGQPLGLTTLYELPLNEWRDVAGSKVRALDFFRALFEMSRIYARYGRGGSKATRLPS